MASEAVPYTPNYSAEDYRQWEGDWELWDGIPVCMPPSPTARHQLVGSNLISIFRAAAGQNDTCDCVVIHETDWQIEDSMVVRPDISVLCHGLPEQFINYPPSVIVEILSPSTAEKDRTAKRQLYASQGVEVYVMADPDTRTIDVLKLSGEKYTSQAVHGDLITVVWRDTCKAEFCLAEVFPE